MSPGTVRTDADAVATGAPLRVGLVSLGCAKNLVDAEIMVGALLEDGLEVLNDTAEADVVIVNTCSFIDAAKEESVDAILESAALREARCRGQGLVVAGCLPQRFSDELPTLMPEVDAFLGIDQVTEVARIVRAAHAHRRQRLAQPTKARRRSSSEPLAEPGRNEVRRVPDLGGSRSGGGSTEPGGSLHEPVETHSGASLILGGHRHRAASANQAVLPQAAPALEVSRRPRYIPDYSTPRFRLTPPHFAYVKIAEGCNHPCSFCIIPRIRGAHRSRQPDDIEEEVRRLVAEGVREINLISQDSTYYGRDLRPRRVDGGPVAVAGAASGPTLATLLRRIQAVPGDFWIRLLYTHPAHWTDELIGTFADCPKVARYVDMPLQHIHDNLLERMRRETSRARIEDLLDRLRSRIPGIALRTTFIVGFPGETETCFESLLDFIRSTRFERLGVFAYSREEGTRAAGMRGRVPDRVKQARRDRAMAEQRLVARAHAAAQVGRVMRVLVEGQATAKDLAETEHTVSESSVKRAKRSPFGEPSTRRSTDRMDPVKPGSEMGTWMVARGEADAPDIDGRVYLRGRFKAGEFARVRITGHADYDLFGALARRTRL